jgi:uncharacterized membrane protein YdbT with pleckstrin-like domain
VRIDEPSPSSYRAYLGEEEAPRLHVRRHPIVLARPGFATAAVVGLAIAVDWVGSPQGAGTPADVFVAAVALVFLLRFAYKVLLWRLDRLVVTDQRMLEISGIIRKRVAAMPLSKLTDVTFTQTLLGRRVFHYGDLHVETAGQEQALTHIEKLPTHDEFYSKLTTLVLRAATPWRTARMYRYDGPGGPRGAASDVAVTQPLPRIEE